MTSLFERLGGEAAIGSVVDKFYEFMMKDPVVNYYFANTDMPKQRQRQKEFITLVTGGPNHYHGSDMKNAHQKMKIAKK
jgi:hemoglobin